MAMASVYLVETGSPVTQWELSIVPHPHQEAEDILDDMGDMFARMVRGYLKDGDFTQLLNAGWRSWKMYARDSLT